MLGGTHLRQNKNGDACYRRFERVIPKQIYSNCENRTQEPLARRPNAVGDGSLPSPGKSACVGRVSNIYMEVFLFNGCYPAFKDHTYFRGYCIDSRTVHEPGSVTRASLPKIGVTNSEKNCVHSAESYYHGYFSHDKLLNADSVCAKETSNNTGKEYNTSYRPQAARSREQPLAPS